MKKLCFALFVLCAISSYAQRITNQEIADMVAINLELNPTNNPDLLLIDELQLWQFRDNPHFQFYIKVKSGDSRWLMAKNLLEVTRMYRPVYWSEHKPLTLKELSMMPEKNLEQPKQIPAAPEKTMLYYCIWYSIDLLLLFLLIFFVIFGLPFPKGRSLIVKKIKLKLWK